MMVGKLSSFNLPFHAKSLGLFRKSTMELNFPGMEINRSSADKIAILPARPLLPD